MDMLFGFLNIYKPAGMTSHDVVAAVRRAAKIKQVGHAGTLDPFAQGVLPVALGKAARLIEFLDDDKEYLATVQFGAATTTYDLEGEVTFTSDKEGNEADIREALKSFEGEIMQVPPMYSAIKIGGKKLYDYARKGETFEVEPRRVTVEEIGLRALDACAQQAEILIQCSKGTYIRSIAHDLGEKLGCGAHLIKLVRTQAGKFRAEKAVLIDELNTPDKIRSNLISPLDVLPQPQREIDTAEFEKIKHGQFLFNKLYKDDEVVILRYNNNVVAVAAARESKLLVKKVLLSLMMIVLSLPAWAAQNDYTCVAPYDLSNGVGRFLAAITGANLSTEKMAQFIGQKIIKKTANTNDLKINLKSFSPMDLKEGRFKSLEIQGENLNVGGISLSGIGLQTLCDFNYIVPDQNKNKIFFKEDLPMRFDVVLSDEDLNNTVATAAYKATVETLNKTVLKNAGGMKIVDTQVKIRNNRFIYVAAVDVPFVKTRQNIVISSDLTIKNGNIRFTDTKLLNDLFIVDVSKAAYLLNFLNPLDYSLNIFENRNAKVKIENALIKDNRIFTDGMVVIGKG